MFYMQILYCYKVFRLISLRYTLYTDSFVDRFQIREIARLGGYEKVPA